MANKNQRAEIIAMLEQALLKIETLKAEIGGAVSKLRETKPEKKTNDVPPMAH